MRQFKTLSYLKQAAKKLKKETGCKHNEALERVARADGYRDYHEAYQVLQVGKEVQP